MQPRIETFPEKKITGKRMKMSFSDNKTGILWKSFMPKRKEIQNTVGTDLYSIQIYAPDFFDYFDPDAEFVKWAAVEVTDFSSVPDGMESFVLTGGLYAVFLYKGAASAAAKTYQYILGNCIPNSEFRLDDRPFFEILGEKYKNEDPDSEEEIWIPVRLK
jgi:AraC family transcriptional regulator